MKLPAIVWFGALLVASNVIADSVTLKNGEVVQGQIISDSDSQVVVEVSNPSRTIVYHQTVSKSDIKSIERDTEQQKRERLAYEALDQWKLDPNQEWSKAQYTSGINVFDGYLASYPGSKFANDVSARRSVWANELAHVEEGQVKLGDQWMAPMAKKLAVLANAVAALRVKLVDLQTRHKQTVTEIENTQAAIAQNQSVAANPPVKWVDAHTTIRPARSAGPGGGYVGVRDGYNPAHYETDNDAAQHAGAAVISGQQQLPKLQEQLRRIEGQINDTARQLADAESAYAQARQPQPPAQ